MLKSICHLLARVIAVVLACAALSSAADAAPFLSQEGNFTADFPSPPTLAKTADKTGGGTPFDQYTWAYDGNTNWWAVMMIVYSKPTKYDYDFAMNTVVTSLKGTLRSQRNIEQSGVTGREFIVDVPQAHVVLRQRLLWVSDRLYEIIFTTTESKESSAEVDAFFNSFHTLK